jgi:glycosyltransferase involved in cell wall biosynthesis
MVRELGLESECEFTGRVPDADVERVLATADVCVSPDPRNPLNDVSTMNKVLEYMACAKPVVCYDLREHRYSAGEGALYAEADVVEDLASKIELLLADPELRARMGAYNRERFLTQMAWEHNAGELLKAYEWLIARPNRDA